MASTTRPRRFHATVVRDAVAGTGYVVLYDCLYGTRKTTVSGHCPSYSDALEVRDTLRRIAATAGEFVCHECCGA